MRSYANRLTNVLGIQLGQLSIVVPLKRLKKPTVLRPNKSRVPSVLHSAIVINILQD